MCSDSTCKEVQLSFDGVQESKSSSVTNDIFSVSFPTCKKVYPIRIIRPANKFKYDVQEQIKKVIDNINECECDLSEFVLDKLKRSTVKCVLGHSSTYACEYCEASAIQVEDPTVPFEQAAIRKKFELRKKSVLNNIEFIKESPGSVLSKQRDDLKIQELEQVLENLEDEKKKELKKAAKFKSHLAWPSSTMNGRLRTQEIIKYVVNKIKRSDGEVDKHERKGIIGQSHLLYQPNFHFINGISAEYMHSTCLGVVKRLVELTFNVGEKRSKTSQRKLSDAEQFNQAIKAVKVVREFSRRFRNLDLSIIKAQEYRNMILFFFPLIIDTIPDNYEEEKKIWLYLAYAVRACIVPNEEFDEIELNNVKNACKKFYTLYEKHFGQKNCSYSVHVVPSHLLRIRGNNPLTHTSAFIYESFYSEMRQLFQPGTSSPLKQIIQNTIMKRSLEKHYCTKPIKYSTVQSEKSGLENNSMIYVFNKDKCHKFYNIVKINDDDSFQCLEQGKFKHNCLITPEINWNSVGVYKIGPSSSSNEITIPKKDIHGKVLKVKNLLITCPLNVLHEQ